MPLPPGRFAGIVAGLRTGARPPHLAARPGPFDRCVPGTEVSDGDEPAPDHGPRARTAVRELPPVPDRASRCPRAGGRICSCFCSMPLPHGSTALALDDTIVPRWARRIAVRGSCLDPVRSSDRHFVETRGLRPKPDAVRAYPVRRANPVLPFPRPSSSHSERACHAEGRRHRPMLDVGRRLVLWARRYRRLGHDVDLAGDSGFRWFCDGPFPGLETGKS